MKSKRRFWLIVCGSTALVLLTCIGGIVVVNALLWEKATIELDDHWAIEWHRKPTHFLGEHKQFFRVLHDGHVQYERSPGYDIGGGYPIIVSFYYTDDGKPRVFLSDEDGGKALFRDSEDGDPHWDLETGASLPMESSNQRIDPFREPGSTLPVKRVVHISEDLEIETLQQP